MTISAWHQYFDILTDKYGNPYFTTAEKDLLFNRAIYKVLDALVTEPDQHVEDMLGALIFRGGVVPTSGFSVAYGTIEAQVSAAYSQTIAIYRVIKVETASATVKYKSYNQRKNGNSFKTATASALTFQYLSGGLEITPVTTEIVYVTFIRKPRTVSLSGPVESDMPEALHNLIIATAVDLAGIATRDEVVAQLNQLNK
jgi:hypothetical protein